MSESPNRNKRTPPPRPPQPTRPHTRLSSILRNSSPSLISSSHSLPSYDEVVPGPSRPRRGSDGDNQPSLERRPIPRRSRTQRKSQRRIRPQITIVASQPMREHPAFSDGSKGSCVPPEAPPSYDEAIQNGSTDNASFHNSSSPGLSSASRRVLTNTETNQTVPSSSGRLHRNNHEAIFTSSPPSAEIRLRRSIERELPASRTCEINENRFSNEIVTTPDLSRSSPVYNTSSSHHHHPIQTRDEGNTQPCSSESLTLPWKPKPPPKKPELAILKSNQSSSLTSSNSSLDLMNNSEDLVGTRVLAPGAGSSSAPTASPRMSQKKPTPRKLPPRPPSSKAPPPPVSSGQASDIEEDFGYASIKAKPQPRKVKPAPAPKPETLEPESSRGQSPGENGEVSEPTYAQVNRMNKTPKTSKNEKLESPMIQVNVAEVPSTSTDQRDEDDGIDPPLIPYTRPPLEDYEGILFNRDHTATQEINDLFGQESSSQVKPVATARHKPSHDDNGHAGSRVSDNTSMQSNTSNETDSVDLEPPYEEVVFKPTRKKKEASPPKPSSHPPTLPPPRKEQGSKSQTCPPLPSSHPVGPPHPNTPPRSPSEISRREKNGSKGIDVIKRKSLRIKEKSLKMFRHRASIEETDTALINKRKTSLDTDGNPISTATVSTNNPTPGPSGKDKSKKVPPPRPNLPVVLQNKLHKPVPPSHNPAPSTKSNITRDVADAPPAHRRIETGDPPHHPTPRARMKDHEDPSGTASVKKSSSEKMKNVPPRPTPKVGKAASMNRPARPPPVRPTQSFRTDSSGKPVLPHPVEEEKEEALFDLLTKGVKNAKKTTDEQMMQFISEEMLCVALEDYDPTNFTDLSFSAGDRITVIKRIDEGLLFGRNEDGEEGPFPEKYVRLEMEESQAKNANSNNNNSVQGATPKGRVKPPLPPKSAKLKQKHSGVLRQVVALYEYQSTASSDLSFVAGDHIDIIQSLDSEWYKGRLRGHFGIFPKVYVSDMVPHMNSIKTNHSKTLYDFNGIHANELSLSEGDEVEVMCRVDTEWLKGRLVRNGKVGIFPSSFVDRVRPDLPMESGTDLPTSLSSGLDKNKGSYDITMTSAPPVNTATALFAFEGDGPDELSFNSTDTIHVTRRVDEDWLEGRIRGRSGRFPASFVQLHTDSHRCAATPP
ncbi:unnamed protein product [Clavelina lepadiformis]|uniref:SH3 domain-containing protein n=1 Tax=Clavelina lepadiformis TaxID=159417 RepID=A0ABP0G4Y1_CLALP